MSKATFLLAALAAGQVRARQRAMGIGFVDGLQGANCSDLFSLRSAWHYTWYSASACGSAGFVPMIWSAAHIDEVASLEGQNFTHLLGFNEPDNPMQANM
jgi:hypothetical protein